MEYNPVCWCGHIKSAHGKKILNGYYRETACLICKDFHCDEWQIEFCTFEVPD